MCRQHMADVEWRGWRCRLAAARQVTATPSPRYHTLGLPPWGAFPRPDHWPTDHLLRTPPSEHHERPCGPLSADFFKWWIKEKCKDVYNDSFLTFSMFTMGFRCINKIACFKWNSEKQSQLHHSFTACAAITSCFASMWHYTRRVQLLPIMFS